MDIVEKMRSLESDHSPDGWPAVTMGQVSALCDEIDRLRAQLNVVQEQKPVAHAVYQGCLSGVHVSMLFNAPKDFSGYLYAAPQPAQAAAIPEGWQLVPIDPTPEMLKEIQLINEFSERALIVRYKAMLSASPKLE